MVAEIRPAQPHGLVAETVGKQDADGLVKSESAGGQQAEVVDDGVAAKVLLAMVESEAFPRLDTIYGDNKYHNHGLYEWMEANVDYRLHVIRRPEDACGFVRLPQRWVVERTFAWLGRSRRLSKDCEKLTITSEAMIKISMIHMMLRRLASDTPAHEFGYDATEKLAA